MKKKIMILLTAAIAIGSASAAFAAADTAKTEETAIVEAAAETAETLETTETAETAEAAEASETAEASEEAAAEEAAEEVAEEVVEEVVSDEISVYINGEKLSFDSAPYIENGTTRVPMRAIFEGLGATVDFDGETKTVTAVKDDVEIKLTIGEDIAFVNGEENKLLVPAEIKNSRTMVPLRFVSEALGAKVDWEGETKTITITNEEETEAPAEETTEEAAEATEEVKEEVKEDTETAVSEEKAEK